MIVTVVNGEFYDYKRLRQELSDAYSFQTDSDSELLIPLYLKYGYMEMMKHLRGEFSFILYDKRRRLVVAGRDRFGIKPLCWYADDERLILASKAKAIHACGVQAEWDEYSLMQALVDTVPAYQSDILQGHPAVGTGSLACMAGQSVRRKTSNIGI